MGEFSVWHWIIVLIVLMFVLLPTIFFCLTLQQALAAVDPPLRDKEPGLAWLLLIPVFSAIWMFIMVAALKSGYLRMSSAGRLRKHSDGAYGIGLATAICWVLGFVPYVNLVVILPGLVLFIIYWIKVAELKGLVVPNGAPAVPGMAN